MCVSRLHLLTINIMREQTPPAFKNQLQHLGQSVKIIMLDILNLYASPNDCKIQEFLLILIDVLVATHVAYIY